MKIIQSIIILALAFSITSSYSQTTMTPLNKFGLSGKMKAKPGKGKGLAALLMQASKIVSNAKGIHLYVVSVEATNPDLIWIMEAWDSKEDHDNSLTLPGVKELITQAMPLIDGKPEGTMLEVIGGKGMDW